MPFCADILPYPVCVPKIQKIVPTRDFSEVGRWTNYTIQTKDAWVEKSFQTHVWERKKIETNRSLQAKGMNEYGDPGVVRYRFGMLNYYTAYFIYFL